MILSEEEIKELKELRFNLLECRVRLEQIVKNLNDDVVIVYKNITRIRTEILEILNEIEKRR